MVNILKQVNIMIGVRRITVEGALPTCKAERPPNPL